jgi:hypothetical protein
VQEHVADAIAEPAATEHDAARGRCRGCAHLCRA